MESNILGPTFSKSYCIFWKDSSSRYWCFVVPRSKIFILLSKTIKATSNFIFERIGNTTLPLKKIPGFENDIAQRWFLQNLRKTRKVKKHNNYSKEVTTEEEPDEYTLVALITRVYNNLHSIFPNVEAYINNQED